jgi:S-adenosylmethionine hydrolase
MPGTVRGEVVRIDHFGNVLTNLRTMVWGDDGLITLTPEHDADAEPVQLSAATAVVSCGWHTIKGINRTYSEVVEGRMLALIGSSGELEIAINQGNASERLSLEVGDPVTIRI